MRVTVWRKYPRVKPEEEDDGIPKDAADIARGLARCRAQHRCRADSQRRTGEYGGRDQEGGTMRGSGGGSNRRSQLRQSWAAPCSVQAKGWTGATRAGLETSHALNVLCRGVRRRATCCPADLASLISGDGSVRMTGHTPPHCDDAAHARRTPSTTSAAASHRRPPTPLARRYYVDAMRNGRGAATRLRGGGNRTAAADDCMDRKGRRAEIGRGPAEDVVSCTARVGLHSASWECLAACTDA